MSVISVREQFTGRKGGFKTIGTDSSRHFRVITNSAYDTDQTIFASGMLPSYNSAHPHNIGIFAREFNAEQEHGAFIWLAHVAYNNEVLGSLPTLAQEAQPIPWLRRVKVVGKSLHGKEALTKAPLITTSTISAWTGNILTAANALNYPLETADVPIQNSAADALEGWEKDVDQFIWSVTWNIPSSSGLPFWIQKLSGSINNAPVPLLGLILPRWSLKLRGFSHSDLLTEKQGPYLSYTYYSVTFDLHYKRDFWFLGIPDRGYRTLSGGNYTNIEDADGLRPVVATLLDGSGGKLASPSTTNVQYRWYAPSPEANFSILPIPASAPVQ